MPIDNQRLPLAADLYNDILDVDPSGKERLDPRAYFFGLAVTGMAALAAAYIAEHYHAPVMLMGLLFGLALNFMGNDERMQPGLNLASKTLLRWGIILLGVRITFSQIADLGAATFLFIAVMICLVIAVGALTARLLKLDVPFGILSGGAVAICGASAALALATLMGEKRISQVQLTITLVCIAAASALAMSIYPPLTHSLGLTDHQAGFVMGAAIHDVAQAIGGGFSISAEAGNVATVVKLSRVAMLAPVLMLLPLFIGKDSDNKSNQSIVPWFLVGFLALVAVSSLFPVPKPVVDIFSTGATAMLLLAVVATGIRSPMQQLLEQGWRTAMPVIIATLSSLGLAIAAAILLF